MTHNYNAYRKGCRCATCRSLNAAYHRAYRAKHLEERREYHRVMMRVYRSAKKAA